MRSSAAAAYRAPWAGALLQIRGTECAVTARVCRGGDGAPCVDTGARPSVAARQAGRAPGSDSDCGVEAIAWSSRARLHYESFWPRVPHILISEAPGGQERGTARPAGGLRLGIEEGGYWRTGLTKESGKSPEKLSRVMKDTELEKL